MMNHNESLNYHIQQAALNEIALKLGVVAYRPNYHRANGDKNTVLFYLKEDAAHNLLVDKHFPRGYSASEARDAMKYHNVKIPDEQVYRDYFFWFENSDVNGHLDYDFANFGRIDLRGVNWKSRLEAEIQKHLKAEMERGHSV